MTSVAAPTPRAPVKRRRKGRSRRSSILLHGTLLFASAIAIFPVLWLGLTSFKRREDITTATLEILPPVWTIANYDFVLSDTQFPTWFFNSVVVAFFTTIVGVFLAATAAYAFSRYRFPAYRPALMSFLVVQMFPMAILIVPFWNIVNNLGLINTKTGLVLAYSTTAVPFCVWMLKGYFDTIPISIEEAGQIDGLTPFGTFWKIVMPLSKPGLAVTGFYAFITAWNEVAYANIFLLEDRNYTLPIGLRTFVNQFETHYEWLNAGAMLVTIPSMVVFLLVQRYLVAGLTRGGVKG